VEDVQAYAELNRAFHECLYRGCRNDYLASQITDIRNRLRAYRRYPFERRGGIERSLSGHQQVVKALLAGDDGQADRAMREHVASAISFLDLVAEMPGPPEAKTIEPVLPPKADTAEKPRRMRRAAASLVRS
jgi:DNA-binding GntR family transcriptional regulator